MLLVLITLSKLSGLSTYEFQNKISYIGDYEHPLHDYVIVCMVEGIIGFSDILSIAQTIGIVGTMVLTLFFSKKHSKLEFSMT